MHNEYCGHGGRRAHRRGGGNWKMVFGPDGPFGPQGPFGPGGVFGPKGPFGPGGPFGDGKGRRGRGRGRRGMFDRDELRLVLLRLIADEPRHGYDLIKALEERSGGAYAPSPGVIYPTLSMLADEGLVSEQPGDDQRRRYAVTAEGSKLLGEDEDAIIALFERLDDVAVRARQDRAPQIERAAMNLFTAVRHRMGEGGEDSLPHDIAEILDEAAQRIERL